MTDLNFSGKRVVVTGAATGVGAALLDVLAERVFADSDPAEVLHHELEQELMTDNGRATLRVPLPFAERGDLELKKIGLEVIVRVGGQKRTIVLPQSMSTYATSGARFEEGALRIFFEKAEDEHAPR